MQHFQFNLDRDLVFFDIESTGLNIIRDRILQIALIKYNKTGGPPEELSMLINPGIPISEEAMAIHGITPDMLRNKPLFYQVSRQIYDFIGNADLAGYNSDRFDVPMLIEEFHRAGLEFDIKSRRLIDVQKIFYKMEPRTLKAAYKLYCGKDLEGAHDALEDVRATVEVLQGQISKYEGVDYIDAEGHITPAPVRNDIKALAEFTMDQNLLDVTQRLKYNASGEVVFNFGKYIGQKVEDVFKTEPSYYHWIMDKEFSAQVKQIVKSIFESMNPK
ncbi:MAG: 3'-5' exonuclease [Saprospiraceae bacterium]|nr:3'-5' exonuclease [Saprospiraceae bacterium]